MLYNFHQQSKQLFGWLLIIIDEERFDLDSSENSDNHEYAGAEEHLNDKINWNNASDPSNWKIASNDSRVIRIIK